MPNSILQVVVVKKFGYPYLNSMKTILLTKFGLGNMIPLDLDLLMMLL